MLSTEEITTATALMGRMDLSFMGKTSEDVMVSHVAQLSDDGISLHQIGRGVEIIIHNDDRFPIYSRLRQICLIQPRNQPDVNRHKEYQPLIENYPPGCPRSGRSFFAFTKRMTVFGEKFNHIMATPDRTEAVAVEIEKRKEKINFGNIVNF